MNQLRLIYRGLRHHRRTHLGALATAALVSAVIIGALGVGDSVRESLSTVADARLGQVRFAAHARDRLWRTDLAGSLARELDTTVSSTLLLHGSVGLQDGSARVAGARVLGVDDAFWALSPGGRAPITEWPEDSCAVSATLANKLGLTIGDSIVVRMEVPALVPRETPISAEGEAVASLLLEVAAICDADAFGRFSLDIGQLPPANVFLPRLRLQQAAQCLGFANTLLVEGGDRKRLAAAVAGSVRIEDTGLTIRHVAGGSAYALQSNRIFLEPAAEQAGLTVAGSQGILTWLVNDLACGDRHTPYSMVAALPPGMASMGADEIVVNTWLAEDLGARVGDRITLTYYVVGDGRKLTEQSAELRVREVVPIKGVYADRDLMPAFPGLSGAENCRDWDPGFALDLDRIRDKDEVYWDEYAGTPKAFIALSKGQELWGNRFGRLTSVRFPGVENPGVYDQAVCAALDPASYGLSFVDLEEANQAARSGGMDFGGLFLGFSFLLVAAALLLMGLVTALNISMRKEEIGTLLALGFTEQRVRRIFAVEHGVVALAGGVVGIAGGFAVAAGAIAALTTIWSDVAGSLSMAVVIRPATALGGALCGAAVSFAVAWLVLRRAVKGTVAEAFTRGDELAARIEKGRRRGVSVFVGAAFVLAGAVLALTAGTGRDPATAGAFFGSGMMLLIGFLCVLWYGLARVGAARPGRRMSASALTLRNLGRRRGRSLAVVGILAFGVFMFLGVTVFRRDRLTSPGDRASGTGGFSLVGESTVAVVHDLNTPEGRAFFALPGAELADVRVVGLRARSGDDASCRSLTRAQTPELVGVNPNDFAGRFTFVKGAGDWEVLNTPLPDNVVPAVIDQATFWNLGKGFGDDLEVMDEEGRPVKIRIAGVIDNSVLNGRLIISSSAFVQRYPSAGGSRRFLIDAPVGRRDRVAALLSRQLQDRGLALEESEVRLNSYNAVENTYLGIFQALGGLGLLLGSVGLALVVGRNVLERRAELALLGAVGFTRRRIIRLMNAEHALLLGLGLLAGLTASTVSLIPAITTPGAQIATPGMAAVLIGLGIGGLVFTGLATRLTLGGSLLENLREE